MQDLFERVLSNIKDGMEITFSKENVAQGDRFLILYGDRKIKVKFNRQGWGIWYVVFDGDERMKLEDCPESFYKSILKNIE